MEKILFVCSANKQRSKTAEDYFSEKLEGYEFKSAGTNIKACIKAGTSPLTEELLVWADKVILMEQKHKDLINKAVGDKYNSKMKVLNIPDKFKFYQKELIAILDIKCAHIL